MFGNPEMGRDEPVTKRLSIWPLTPDSGRQQVMRVKLVSWQMKELVLQETG